MLSLVFGSQATSFSSLVRSKKIRIPLVRPSNHWQTPDSIEKLSSSSKTITNKQFVHGQDHTTNLEPEILTNQQNLLYYGSVKIGTPGRTAEVLFDTSASIAWFPSVDCLDTCFSKRLYNHSKSSTYKQDGRQFRVDYGPYPVKGYLSSDTIRVAGVDIKGQSFGEATFLGGMFAEMPTDGLIGLGLGNQFSSDLKSPFQNMLDQKLVAEPIFSFYLNTNTSDPLGGELIFGGVDNAHFNGDFKYAPLSQNNKWSIRLDSMVVGLNETIPLGDTNEAIIDTTSTLIGGPQNQIALLNKKLRAKPFQKGIYKLNCDELDQLPDISLIINKEKYTLNSSQYVFKIETGFEPTICVSGFGESGTDSWIIGYTFLGSYYSVFDAGNQRVGFARSK